MRGSLLSSRRKLHSDRKEAGVAANRLLSHVNKHAIARFNDIVHGEAATVVIENVFRTVVQR